MQVIRPCGDDISATDHAQPEVMGRRRKSNVVHGAWLVETRRAAGRIQISSINMVYGAHRPANGDDLLVQPRHQPDVRGLTIREG